MADLKYTGAQVADALDKALSATQPTDIAKVATSGSYNDLKDKPTIPSAVTVDASLSTTSTNPVQNKAVAAGINAKYTKPTTGIPKSDLASAVQASLGKADTALQSEQYKGTVTGVKINGSTKSPSNGVVDLGTVVTDVSGKQDELVSGTNIKTLNGQSILGSGDLAIGGGDSGIITFEKIYPQRIGDAITYRVPAGSTCELVITEDFTPGENTYIEIIFEGVPMVTYDDATVGDYVGSPSVSKYHIRCVHYGCPVSFKIEGVDGSSFYTNGGEEFDPTLGWSFELDALCQNAKWFSSDYGGHIISGEIYGAFAIYN